MVFNLAAKPRAHKSRKAIPTPSASRLQAAQIYVQYAVYKIYTWLFCHIKLKKNPNKAAQTELMGALHLLDCLSILFVKRCHN